MKTEFHEDFRSEHADPLDTQECDFDWTSLYASLGEDQAEVSEHDYKAMSHAVRVLFAWILKVDPQKPCSERTIARRLIGLAWTIDPSLIDGSPSLTAIAKTLSCHKVVLSIHSAQAHRHFGIRNRAQSHGWNFKANDSQAKPANAQKPAKRRKQSQP